MPNEDAIDVIAAAIADGAAVDWDALEANARSPEQRATIRQFRTLQHLAHLYRPGPDHDSDPSFLTVTPASVQRAAAAGNSPPTGDRGMDRWHHLHLIEKIGEGTFGEVFRAWDSRLDRTVALKLLRARDASDLDVTPTIIDEGRLLAKVRHPNVATVYDADRIDGRVGIWMEFVEGRTLASLVRADGAIGAPEATLIGIELCRALTAVHEAGLIHRDIKAQNVMRETGGRVVLMDFGLGREADPSGGATDSGVTGTPLYVAPEIFRGEPATVQSDIYSLGVLLYHLVTGSYPVSGRSVNAVRRAHQRGDRQVLRLVRPDLPTAFSAVVERATSTAPAQRYESARALEQALSLTLPVSPVPIPDAGPTDGGEKPLRPLRDVRSRTRVVAGLGIVTLAFLGYTLWRSATPAGPVLPFDARDWVLVAAFDNRTGEPVLDRTVEYALERELANSPFLNVVPEERVDDLLRLMQQPASRVLTAGLARELCLRDGNIRALITGRAEKVGTTYMFSAHIVDPVDGRTVASVSEDADALSRAFPAVRRLADQVRRLLGESRASMQSDAAQLEHVTTPSLKALELYSEAVRAQDGGDAAVSEQLTRSAIAEDPAFASAHAWLGWLLVSLGRADEAIREVERAVELADTATPREQLFIRAADHEVRYYAWLQTRAEGGPERTRRSTGIERQRTEAIAAYEAFLRVYPDDYRAANTLAQLYGTMARTEDILRMAAKAARLRPANLFANFQAAWNYVVYTGDLAAASPFLARARALVTPETPAWHRQWLEFESIFEDWLNGDLARVVDRLDQIVSTQRDPLFLSWAVRFNVALGRLAAAEDACRLKPGPDRPSAAAFDRALIAYSRNDRSSARTWARQLRQQKGQHPMEDVWLLAQVGLQEQAEAIVRDWESTGEDLESPGFLTEKATVLLARGDTGEAIVKLRHAPGGAFGLIGADTLATALEREGNLAGASAILEEATRERSRLYGGPIGFPLVMWVRLRAHLLRLYRRSDRSAEAAAIEAELRQLLAFADPDYNADADPSPNLGVAVVGRVR